MVAIRKAHLILCCILVFGLISTACSKNDNKATQNESSGTAQNASGGSEEPQSTGLPMVNGKYDPPVTLTTVRGVAAVTEYKNGETADDNVHYRWAKERLGIEINNLWSVVDTNSTYSNKIKLSLLSNEELPDIVKANDATARLLIDSGKYADAGALFDKYASETWKKAIAEEPDVWNEFTRDGVRYGIPVLEPGYNTDPVLWIRKDWLDKLGLQPPKTIEEFEKVLDAFTNQDPDGNNQNDTYGIAAGMKGSFNDSCNFGWVFGAYGGMPHYWLKMPDDTLGYGSIQPGMKQGLAKIKEWVDKGYMPVEGSIWNESKAASLVATGKAGMYAGPHWADVWPIVDWQKNIPEAEWLTVPLPTGPDGKSMHYSNLPYNGAIFISKEMEHPEIFFTYANYLFENQADPKPGSEFENGWAKGYDWDIVDGQVTQDPEKIPGGAVNVIFYTLFNHGANIPSLYMRSYIDSFAQGGPVTPNQKYWWNTATEVEREAAVNVWNSRQFSVHNAYTGAPTDTMQKKGEYLMKLEMETFGKIIFGDASVDEFDKFVEDWKSGGGDQMIQEVNDWYKSVGGSK